MKTGLNPERSTTKPNEVVMDATRIHRLLHRLRVSAGCCSLFIGVCCSPAQQALPTTANQARQEAAGATTEALKSMLESGDSLRQHSALGQLGIRRTDEARVLLLKAAYGAYGRANEERAARCFVNSLDDRSQARALLNMTNTTALGAVLAAMYGLPIDPSLLTEIQRLLGSPSLYVRGNCVGLIEKDPSGLHGPEKVRMMLDSLQSAMTLPTATQFEGIHGYAVGEWTRLGAFAFDITRTLSESKGIEPAMLEQETPRRSGLVRECLIVARGWRGDRNVKAELRQVMDGGTLPEVRVLAVNSFETMAEPADRAVLERIASQDPFAVKVPKGLASNVRQMRPLAMAVVRPQGGVPEDDSETEVYRVREAARHALLRLDLRHQAGTASSNH